MASVNQGKVTFISYKLTFLKDQRDRLISAVGLYVNRMLAAGESWKQGGDNTVEYKELCQKIDTAVEFLCEKCEELADGSVLIGANQISFEQPGVTSQSTTPTTTTSATSWRQHTSPPASTARAESVQPADEAQLRPVLAKIAVIEEALCSFRSRTEKVAEQQSCIEQQLKELLSRVSESDKKHSSMLKQMKQQSGIEQQLEELLSRVSESDKKHSSRFKQMKQQISDMQDATEQEQKTRLQSLEKQLQKISTTQNKLKVEMESQAEVVAKHVHVPNQLETVKENLDAIDARIDRIVLDCSTRHEDLTTEMRGLTGKVMANTGQLISEGQAKETTLLRELETRLQTLEADGGRTVKEVQKQAEKGEAKFRVLCQIVSDRLRPLEQLRTCLNERASQRDDNITKLSQVIQEVAVMSPRLQQLELNPAGAVCGFSAHMWVTLAPQDTIHQYKIKYCNVGKNFDADSGIFTAPVDGLYVASISVWLSENGELRAGVRHKLDLNQSSSALVCQVVAETKYTSVCRVGVVRMEAELKSPGTSCGFSAQTWFTGEVAQDTIEKYKIKFSSVGKSFDAGSGTFTAPVDGLYVACISLCLSENEELQVVVKHKHYSGHISSASVCESSAAQKGTTACGVGVVGMKAGDMLFSFVNHMDQNDDDKMVFFSCFLLG